MSTNVPDVQEELIDLLAASTQLTGVLISFAPPLEVPKQNERIYGFSETAYTLGGGEQFRSESFGLRLIVEVFRSGSDARAVNRRRWELIDAIDTILSDDNFQGYYTDGLALSAESELAAYDTGYLARSVLTLGAREEV